MKKRLFIIGLVAFFVDQISKLIIINTFSLNESKVLIKSFFSLTYIKNLGAAWGMFSNSTIILILISLIFLYFFIKYIFELKTISVLNTISFGIILGGIVGNLFDRLVRGYVIDFLNFEIFSYDFPVFNIADTFIVVGIILVLIEMLLVGDKNEK